MSNGRKVIFLDIDGVLQPTWKQDRFNHDMDELRRVLAAWFDNEEYLEMDKYDLAAVYFDWDREAVERLRALCDNFGAEIVISSAWREYSGLLRLKDYFRIYDLDRYVTDVTAQIHDLERSRAGEVAHYLAEHPEIEKFVILDDSYLSYFRALFPDHFVECYPILGEDEYAKAAKLLADP